MANALSLSPDSKVLFRGHRDDTIVSQLNARNNSEKHLLFKIKTTAPKKYSVKPNSGLMRPMTDFSVDISYQPKSGDIPAPKDKFLFMWLEIGQEEASWDPARQQDLFKERPMETNEKKLKTLFEEIDRETEDDRLNNTSPDILPPYDTSIDETHFEEIRSLKSDIAQLSMAFEQSQSNTARLNSTIQELEDKILELSAPAEAPIQHTQSSNLNMVLLSVILSIIAALALQYIPVSV
eukprot:TRINITY_DN25932_c0_g1_i1.p1 TRINITY_DN25932_c0_g1~~TRINITY_DN25932_c0_g1_i1.p1  ORF type:complete len:237 (-),score=57.80 TRINITY_DN25932_c0_g1_i1:60-770(-)